MQKTLGMIISGSLADGFLMRIHTHSKLEDIKTGKFVCIKGESHKFFALISDLSLEVSQPDIMRFPPEPHETLLCNILKVRDMYALARLRPLLMVTNDDVLMPVKTIPSHFAQVHDAQRSDVARIFGDESDASNNFFSVGSPLDMDASVCIDLQKFTERSNGIFGKTGTGKTFLTRLVLAGLMKHHKAVTLIFDMHSEYGLQARKEGSETFVKGLKTLFPDRVSLFSLDPESTRRRGGMPDVQVVLSYDSVQVDDIISLNEELNLHATACEAAYLLASRYKKKWLSTLLEKGDQLKELAAEVGAHPESISALYRKLKLIERLPFFVPHAQEDVADRMIECIDRGVSVIIEFGNYTSTFCYLLVANIITRRIHALYMKKTEYFLGSRSRSDEPKKLMIVIEEAHKFLNPQAARQTIFGVIAREMRKYYVSLLVVDQRPSGIDPEIVSQIGTKIVAQLNDERDIQAVLTGVSNAHQFRSILASLDTKKQVLLFGHAVAMPVVVETRTYDEAFYASLITPVQKISFEQVINDIF